MKKIPYVLFVLFGIVIVFAFMVQANQAVRLTAQTKQIYMEAQELHEEVKELEPLVEAFNPVVKEDNLTPLGEYEITYYCSCKKCCGKSDGITASGEKAVEGTTVGADTRFLSFGTKIFIEGIGERTVQDRGGAIKGERLDVYVDSHQKALQLGRHKANVFIVEKE